MRVICRIPGPAHPDLFDGTTPLWREREIELKAWLVRFVFPGGTDEFVAVAAESKEQARRLGYRLANRYPWNHILMPDEIYIEGILPREPTDLEVQAWDEVMKRETIG